MSRAIRSVCLAAAALAGCEIVFPAGDLSTEARGDGSSIAPDGGESGTGGGAAGSGGESGTSGQGGTSGVAGASGKSGASGKGGTGGIGGQSGNGGVGGSSVAGFPTTECQPGDTMAVGACDMCGQMTKHCDASGNWGPAACEMQGVCMPGQSDSTGCGNCGTKKRTCNMMCQWPDWGSCSGEGPCAPGQTQAGGCDECAQQTCGNDCQWKGCALKPNAECEYKNGTSWQCCGAGKWQFCAGSGSSNPCHWYACAACSGCGCLRIAGDPRTDRGRSLVSRARAFRREISLISCVVRGLLYLGRGAPP